MKGERKYLAILSIVVLVYLIFQFLVPRKHDWDITLYHRDKDPYGTYVLNELLPGVFPGKSIRHSNLTFYEWLDSIPEKANVISLSIWFTPPAEDVNALLRHVEKGGNILIASEFFSGPFVDTLKVYTSTNFVPAIDGNNPLTDSTRIHLTDTLMAPAVLKVSGRHARSYFDLSEADSAEVLAVAEDEKPVLIRIRKGKGTIVLSSTPFAFTNINILSQENAALLEEYFKLLPAEEVYWTEYYHRGRQEASTSLRYILSVESLRWAYYTTMGSLILYIVFAAKRRQRSIPVITPPANTTLEFVKTIGNLYFRTADHKRIAEKRIAFFLENLRSRLHHPGLQPTEEMVEIVSQKTAHPKEAVREVFALIRKISQQTTLNESELKIFSEKLDKLTVHS